MGMQGLFVVTTMPILVGMVEGGVVMVATGAGSDDGGSGDGNHDIYAYDDV